MPPEQMGEGPFQPNETAGGEEPPVQYLPPSHSTPPPPQRRRRSPLRGVIEFIVIFAGAIIAAYLLQAYFIKPFQIPSESMEPTIYPGDRILVNRLAYRFGAVGRGDVIVFKSPNNPDVDYVKRVIAVAGDTIEVKRGQVILNGEPQSEPYATSIDMSTFPMQTVPEGTVFVMGDNRAESQDSRYWKPPWLPLDNIVGKAFITYWPPSKLGTI